MSLMNPSIDASVDVTSTDKGSAVTICLAEYFFSSCESKDWCGKFRSSMSKDSSRSRSLPWYIAASRTVVYSAGSGVVPKFNLRQRKAILLTISIHVDVIVVLAWICW